MWVSADNYAWKESVLLCHTGGFSAILESLLPGFYVQRCDPVVTLGCVMTYRSQVIVVLILLCCSDVGFIYIRVALSYNQFGSINCISSFDNTMVNFGCLLVVLVFIFSLQFQVILSIHLKITVSGCYTQWTWKLSPQLLDAVKVKVFFCWSNSDIMANTNTNML